ncbi:MULTISPECIES: hypothetical protein [unclassified Bacillus (in: firmicutes)]|uniref:hypothetical protein n=1 Tax=unclassified Bacillus (in: firmicutes) TaxID=185979 RepID=UPI002034F7AD|nr:MULTISPECIES: hypothetical protein [unclassified Bacillus (in: firmicutes)]
MALGKRSLTFYAWNETMPVLLLSPVTLDLGGRVSRGYSCYDCSRNLVSFSRFGDFIGKT